MIIKKFKNAINGLLIAYHDHSIVIQIILAIITIVFGSIYHFTNSQWLWVILAITLVIACEMINTCIEKICNMIDNNYNLKIKEIKDLSAGFTLVTAIFALIVFIFIILGLI